MTLGDKIERVYMRVEVLSFHLVPISVKWRKKDWIRASFNDFKVDFRFDASIAHTRNIDNRILHPRFSLDQFLVSS